MQDRVYSGFASRQQKDTYVCRSEINKKLLRELFLDTWFTIEEVLVVFDYITTRMPSKYIIVKTGNSRDINKQRHTKYVKKSILCNETLDYYFTGLPDSCKMQI